MKVKRSEIVFVGDLHLEGLNSLFGAEQGNKYILETLQSAIKYCQENGVTTIINLGDIFDGPNPSQQAIVGLLQVILAAPGITFHTIIGNHDRKDRAIHSAAMLEFVSKANILPNLKVYTEPTYAEIKGAPIYFMPWPCYKQVERRPHPCINIAHLRLTGAMADNGRPMGEGEAEIEVGNDYWVVGDLHSRQKLGKRVLYPGNSFQKTFGESLPKGITHTEVVWGGNKLKVVHKYVPMEPPFRLINLEINSVADFDLVEAIPAYRYKLFINDELTLPTGFLADHPNVVSAIGFKTKTDLIALQHNEIDIESVPCLDAKRISTLKLGAFLHQRGFTPAKIKRSRSIVRNIVAELGAL